MGGRTAIAPNNVENSYSTASTAHKKYRKRLIHNEQFVSVCILHRRPNPIADTHEDHFHASKRPREGNIMKFAGMTLAACLALSGVGTAASAASVDLSSGSGGFVSTPAAGAFAELYTFSLSTPLTLTGIVSSNVAGGQNVDFTSLVLTGPSGPLSFSLINPDPFEVWTISTGNLAAGSYTLTASGSNSAAIGTYSGSLALSASGSAPPASTGGPVDLSSGSGGFVNTPEAGAFVNLYTFTLGAAATMTGIVSSADSGAQDVDFASLILTGPSGPLSFSQFNSDPFEVWRISTGVLAPGSYTLAASGTNSAAIGTYSGTIALSATVTEPPGQAPEPGSWALILVGLGAALGINRRRASRAVLIENTGSVTELRARR